MKINHLVFAAMAALALNQSANAQNIIGVGGPTGSTRTDVYPCAGFEFYVPLSGTTINALGYWDATGNGLQMAHTVSIYKYSGSGSGYDLVVTATVPVGTDAPLINGYRWVGIPTLFLPNNGQGGGYYAIMASHGVDTWANSIGSAPYLNSAIGTVSGQGNEDVLLGTPGPINIGGTGNPNQGFGGPNLALLNPAVAIPAPIVWTAEGTFASDTVLALAGTTNNEVYGVDFGGSGAQTTANGYTFNDNVASGNMSVANSPNSFGGYMTGGATTGDAALDTILTFGLYGQVPNSGTLNNLTVGQAYTVMALLDDTRGAAAGGSTFAIDAETGFSPGQTYAFTNGAPEVGGYLMGTFTATTTYEPFTIENNPGNAIQYNAVLLEAIPSTAIQLISNTTPASASVGEGGEVVFAAAFSNAVILQWQFVADGTTNNIDNGGDGGNATVVTVTHNGVESSTLTLNNLQLSNSGSYQLEAINNGDAVTTGYSVAAPLTVVPVITWYPGTSYEGTFSSDSVLAFAGAPSNEVYGVDFGGSYSQTTGNGYTFDDYEATGNMSIANNPSSYGGYLEGGATTGDSSLDVMLAYGVYGQTDNTGTLNNLTVGQAYTVLVLLDDTRGAAAGGSVFYVTDGETYSPGQQYAFPNGTPEVGGYIMGTFTAEQTTQPLTVLNVLGAASQYNLVLLETGIAPPPPLPPSVTADVTPLLSDVPVGAAMIFSVGVYGGGPLYYQWSNQNGAILGATNSSYSFNALAGTNSYYVGISNGEGVATSSTAVVIGETNAPPLVSFDGGTNWSINDNGNVIPTFTGNLLELTDGNPAGGEADSSFYVAGQYVGGFVASFIYQTPSDGGADGITFCMQDAPAGTNALGAPGGALGYLGITPSIAFEMNLYVNAIHGGVGVLLETNGNVSSFDNSGYASTAPVNIASGDNIYVQLYYMQGVMNLLMVDASTPATFTASYPINVPAVVGNSSAYIGFTGSDGGVSSIQTVSDLLYSYTTPPVLTITPGAPGYVVVSWPVSVSSLFTLMQSSNVTGPWSPVVPVSSAVVGLQNQVTLSAGGSASFYTLLLTDPNAP